MDVFYGRAADVVCGGVFFHVHSYFDHNVFKAFIVQSMIETFDNKQVLITGGLGFIGSSLAISLVHKGAKVTIVDNLLPQQGGNLFNIEPIKRKVKISFSDIRDASVMAQLVGGKDYLFHLARQTDHILSLQDPFPDIDINVRGTTVILEACKKSNPNLKFIYIGTRGQYGKAVTLPVSEDSPVNPRGIYEVTNLAAEKIVQIYHAIHGIRSIMLRLTNIYGPRAQMKHDHFGVVNWFIRLALDGTPIPVYGDGSLKRDFLYIDDAVDAIVLAASCEHCYGEVINIGKDKPETFLTLVNTIITCSQGGSYIMTPFSKERAAQEPGDFASDVTKIKRLTGWLPSTSLTEGIITTLEYYGANKKHYW